MEPPVTWRHVRYAGFWAGLRGDLVNEPVEAVFTFDPDMDDPFDDDGGGGDDVDVLERLDRLEEELREIRELLERLLGE